MTASIKKLGGGGSAAPGAGGAADYYEAELRQMDAERREEARTGDPSRAVDDYMQADPNAPLARWWSAAGDLAPDGAPLLPNQLRGALDGVGLDGKRLVQDAARGNRVGGWDVTFSAPKSVSALYATTDATTRRAIMEDIAASASAALRSAHEAGAFVTRTGKGATVQEPARDVMAALFPQVTSRSGQPQLHCHSVVLNAAQRANGTTGALHSPPLYAEKTVMGAVFRAELASRLEQRGLAVERDGQAFAVAGVSRDLCAAWSDRRGQILEATAGTQNLSGKAQRVAKERAAQATRNRKDTLPRTADIESGWKSDLAELGLSAEAVWQSAREAAAQHKRPELRAGDAAIAEAFEHSSITTPRTLRRLVAEHTQLTGGGAAAASAEYQRIMESGPLLALRQNSKGEQVLTTRAVLDAERAVILDATQRQSEAPVIAAASAETAIAARPTLSPEQAAAVRHMALPGGVKAIEGLAGVGKSFAMGAVREAAEASGVRVIGLAPSHAARHVLKADAKLSSTATLQGMAKGLEERRIRFGAAPPGQQQRGVTYLGAGPTLLLVDEAGMASRGDLGTVLRHARQHGVHIALIGDRGQLRAVEGGSAFSAIADSLPIARLAEIRRQTGWQREASKAFARGDGAEGLARYDGKGRVVWAQSEADAVKRTVDAWAANKAKHPTASRIVMASTNAAVHEINAAIRTRLIASGDLGAEAVTVRTLHTGGRSGAGEERDLELRQGDRVIVGATLTREGRDVTAGDQAVVQGFIRDADPRLTLKLDRTGQEVTLRLSELTPKIRGQEQGAPRLQHSYAGTIHRSQGATADFAILHAGTGLDAARAYVGATRHRKDLVIVADAGAIAETLRTEGNKTGPEEIRTAFLRSARASPDGPNAADYVPDRAEWLRTGSPTAKAPERQETRLQGIVRRAGEAIVTLRQQIAQRLRFRQATHQHEAEKLRQRQEHRHKPEAQEASSDRDAWSAMEALGAKARERQPHRQRQGPTMGMGR